MKAAFSVVSLTPGRAVLDASASVPPGTSATSYSWNITGGAHPDAICKGSEPQLTVMTRGALNTTVSLTATDAQGVASTTACALAIAAPALRLLACRARVGRSHERSFRAPGGGQRRSAPPSRCSANAPGAVHPALAPLTSAGERLAAKGVGLGVRPLGSIGAPPEECNQDIEFGAADVLGCLKQIEEPNELPGGITTALAGLLCGAHDQSFCTPALSAAAHAGASFVEEELGAAAASQRAPPGGLAARQASVVEQRATQLVPSALKRMGFPSYYSWTAVRIDGLDIDPQNGQPILVIPAASIVVSADASIYLLGHQISPLHTVALYLPAAGGSLGEISLPHKLPLIGSLPFSGSIAVALQRAGSDAGKRRHLRV